MTMYDVACSDVLEAAVNDQKVTIFASDRERQIRPPPIGDVDLILAGARKSHLVEFRPFLPLLRLLA